MEIEILQQTCGGTGFVARPHRLHLGAQNAEGVDQLHFILPESWADCTLALYLRRRDGTQLAPIPLDAENCVTVDRRLTGSTGGQWMLAAVRDENYTAYTRPGSYEVYPTLPTDGGSEDLPPSLYEQFVARVLESARAAADSARKAETSAADTALQASLAQKAADQILADHVDAADCARRAEEAAQRAERIAPTEGVVSSVNGKGGVVQLTAADVAAVPRPAAPRPGEMVRILRVDADTGAVQTDTAALPDLRPYLRKDAVPAAKTTGGVRADPAYGITVRSDATMTTAPATKEQLDAMTETYAPLAPALLPYGVKKALTDAFTAGEWTEEDKLIALLQLSTDSYFYTKKEANKRFALPAATADTLGGVKVGSGLTVGTDGTLALTAADLNGVLGFAPARLPYTMVYDHSYSGTVYPTSAGGKLATASAPVKIPLHGDYDAILVTSSTPAPTKDNETEVYRSRMLLQLILERDYYTRMDTVHYITLKGLSTSFQNEATVNSGLIRVNALWNSEKLYLRYSDRTLELYSTETDTTNFKAEKAALGYAGYIYHVFGITLDDSIQPVYENWSSGGSGGSIA